ncbi:hypothetical protein [Hymenobacter terrenus]|uniref:hypothetical protein n=1 Tax=Hymenobacter terrenus TaxID=1629124 RepID=UPI0006192196|nr:hypothetical protein [Hymenobacter terrenus]
MYLTRLLLIASMLVLLLGGCRKAIVNLLIPDAPPYPHYQNKAATVAEGQRISDRLEAYIKRWLDGKAPAQLPDSLLPVGATPEVTHWVLQRPEQVRAETQWLIREAGPLNPQRLQGYYPDLHCTYLVLGACFAPFGTKLIIEGEFPHSRFFDIQLSPPLDPAFYYYDGTFGSPEVPIVDVDIDPLPGHNNPFRVGANRQATKRGYRVEYQLANGNGAVLDPAYRPPHFRAPGNRRFGSAIQYQGALADPKFSIGGHKRGVWNTGSLWVRYYAPDRAAGSRGGVPLPKVLFELADGRRFFLNADFSALTARLNKASAGRPSPPADPGPEQGPTVGWARDLDIFHNGLLGIFQANGKTTAADKTEIRDLDLGVTGRGPQQPAPGNYESSASRCLYISYLSRGMTLGKDKVIVLTGRLPTTPRTLAGNPRMEKAQARYFSITAYPEPNWLDLSTIGIPSSCVMDEEIVTDKDGRYVLVYSLPENRPRNATPANGVTWLDWGPQAHGGWTIRWLHVFPDWKDLKITPDEANLPARFSDWASTTYNPALTGRNDQSGFLGEYQPQVHYLTKFDFEALGNGFSPRQVPVWK